MAALGDSTIPLDKQFGDMLLGSPHTVSFSVGRVELATFQTNAKGFKCMNDTEETCIKILVKKDCLKLDEYFFTNREPCLMQPVPGVRDPRHGLFLNEMLEYMATITGHTTIKVEDESTKAIGVCPRVHVRILKLAGEHTFYEKIGGFRNQLLDDRYKTARAATALDKGYIIQKAKAANIHLDNDETLGSLAKKLIKECSNPQQADSKSVSELMSILIEEVRSISTRYLIRAETWDDDLYEKTVTLRFRHTVDHSSDGLAYFPYVSGTLNEYVRVKILPMSTGGTKKRRKLKKRRSCKWSFTPKNRV